MRMNDMILVSVDDHSIEPPDMYERHLPGEIQEHRLQRSFAMIRGVDLVGLPGSGDLHAVRNGGDRRVAPR